MADVVRPIDEGSDAVFSPDGTRLYVSRSNDTAVYDVATGVLSGTITGSGWASLDVSVDGRYLVQALQRSDLVSQSGSTTTWNTYVNVTDLATDTTTTLTRSFVTSAFGPIAGYADVLALPNGKALLAERFAIDSERTFAPTLDLASGLFATSASVLSGRSILIADAQRGAALLIQADLPGAPLAILDGDGEIVVRRTAAQYGLDGVNIGAQAISVAAGKVVQGVRLNSGEHALALYDLDLNYIGNILPSLDASIGFGEINSVSFSPDGSRLYAANGITNAIYEFDTADWSLLESWAVGAARDSLLLNNANSRIAISGDGSNLSLVGTSVALLDLTQSNEVRGTASANDLQGADGPQILYGAAGNDRLDGKAGADTMIGGDGDDIYFVDDVHDIVLEKAGGGIDTVVTSVDFTAPANVEILQLAEGSLATITGRPGVGTRLIGNELGTILQGSSRDDMLIGGRGDDTLVTPGTVIVGARLADSVVSVFARGTNFIPTRPTEVVSADGFDRISGAEKIQFDDGTIYTANAYGIDQAILTYTGRHASATELSQLSSILTTPASTAQIQALVRALILKDTPDDDFNGDGRHDILWRHVDGHLSNWLGDPDGGFAPNDANALSLVGTNWRTVGTGDFNGDGRDDILWRSAEGELTNWLGRADGGFYGNNDAALVSVGGGWEIAHTGDFNGDGRDDVLWRNADGRVSNWLARADGGFTPNDAYALTLVGTNWHIVGTGDFNGDGRDDILWRSDEGDLAQWQANLQGGFTALDSQIVRVPTDWHVVGVGDYDGDGIDDILWRNDSGLLSNWLTRNAMFFPNDPIALTYADPLWQVQPNDDLVL